MEPSSLRLGKALLRPSLPEGLSLFPNYNLLLLFHRLRMKLHSLLPPGSLCPLGHRGDGEEAMETEAKGGRPLWWAWAGPSSGGVSSLQWESH